MPPPLRAKRSFSPARTAILLPLLYCLTTACADPNKDRSRSDPSACKPHRRVIGKSVEGRPIESISFGDGPDTILLIATIHGNEPAGTPLLHGLAAHLSQNPLLCRGRRITLLPEVNPDGHAHGTRHNIHGVDLNRNFPAANFRHTADHGNEALCEPESRAIWQIIQDQRPHRIISFHQPAHFGNPCIDFDGPADRLADALARASDLPVIRLGSRPGSLGSYAGLSLRIPIITVELPREATQWNQEQIWKRYGQMLLTAVRFTPD